MTDKKGVLVLNIYFKEIKKDLNSNLTFTVLPLSYLNLKKTFIFMEIWTDKKKINPSKNIIYLEAKVNFGKKLIKFPKINKIEL